MALVFSLNHNVHHKQQHQLIKSPKFSSNQNCNFNQCLAGNRELSFPRSPYIQQRSPVFSCSEEESSQSSPEDEEVDNVGVKAALTMLRFYKREISPLLPNSCRYVPTCSEYSMIAYKKYGVVKGTILIAWRLCRCNPLGGSGFHPPRWFDETGRPED